MIQKACLLFALLLAPPMALAGDPNPTCENLLEAEISEADVIRMKEQFQKIDRGSERAANRENIAPIQPEDLKAFKSPSKLMTILKKLSQHHVNPALIFWWAIEKHIFKEPTHATPEIVLEYGLPAHEKFEDLFTLGFDFPTLYKEAHQGQVQAKRNLASTLKKLNLIGSEYFGQPIDLLTESGWLTLLGVESSAEIGSQIELLRIKDRELSLQISKYLVDLSTYEGLSRYYHNHFFENGRRRMAKDAEPLVEKLTFLEIKNLISELGFSADKQQELWAQIDVLVERGREHTLNTRALAVLIFYKAYLDRFESIPMLTDQPVGERFITARQFLQVKQRTHQYHLMNAFLNAQFEEYAQESEQVNQRIRSLRQRFTDLHSNLQLPQEPAEAIEAALSKTQEVHELDQDLEATKQSVNDLELQLDELVESVVSQMEKERLKSLSELNFRGHRLIANKPYSIEGVDYGSVVFTEEVVAFLKAQPAEGARFLGALTKGYVAVKKSSGLRRLPNIHPDFRDIKVINSNYGKVRLVGKRVGSTIYFFYVYQSEKPYDSKQIRVKVENFQP